MINKKRDGDILFLCQYFYPEKNSSATLPYDTARFFVEHGYRVGVLCGYPKEYFEGEKASYTDEIHGIKINRIPYIQTRRVGKIGRLINNLSFTAGVMFHAGLFKRYRCIVCYSNPPILPAVAARAARREGTKLVFVAYDIYPEIAYASTNIKKSGIMDRVMRGINHVVYKYSDMVIVLSEEMRDFILKNRPETDSDRVTVIHNWAHEENEYQGEGTAADWQSDTLKVSYFGNMGICQDIDTMLEAAAGTEKESRIQFEMVGHGNKKEAAERFIREKGLTNIKVSAYTVGKSLRKKLSDSGCLVVSLTEGVRGMCAPSKYYTYLYAGRPILSVMEKDSYISREIMEEGIGFAVENGDSDGFVSALFRLLNDPETAGEMGRRARKLYVSRYCYGRAMEKYKEVIDRLLN